MHEVPLRISEETPFLLGRFLSKNPAPLLQAAFL